MVLHTVGFQGRPITASDIRQWHLERGWSDIGYHYYIRYNGDIEPGRREDRVGAHAYGFNSRSIGICLEGHGDYEVWTPAQCFSLVLLIQRLMKEYAIDVSAVIGHRETPWEEEHRIKSCPGNKIDMDEVRAWLSRDTSRKSIYSVSLA